MILKDCLGIPLQKENTVVMDLVQQRDNPKNRDSSHERKYLGQPTGNIRHVPNDNRPIRLALPRSQNVYLAIVTEHASKFREASSSLP